MLHLLFTYCTDLNSGSCFNTFNSLKLVLSYWCFATKTITSVYCAYYPARYFHSENVTFTFYDAVLIFSNAYFPVQCASILGTVQFLYIDLFITTSIAVLMGYTGPAARLVSERPMGSLTSASNIVPLVLQVFVTVAVQIATLYFLMKQPW
jgi:hypothetical protein